MAVFFPTPYPDEIMYSLLSRYHERSLNLFTNSTLFELFGKNTVRINTWLQGNLSLLASHLPALCTLTPEKLIEDHSLLPLFTPFVIEEKILEVKEAMINVELKSVTTVHNKVGTGARHYDSSLYYCTSCANKDRKDYGEAYWHRVHQIPGVLICPYHEELLKKFYPSIKGGILDLTHLDNLYISTDDAKSINVNNQTVINLLNIAKDLQWILTTRLQPLKSYDFFYEKYRYLLKKKGLATPSGIINSLDYLKNEIKDYFGLETLELLDCADLPEHNDKYHWLYNITRKSRKSSSPIHHVLISRFLLDGSVEGIFNDEVPNTIFGNGPWVCLNSVAPHYKERCVKKVEVKYSNRTQKPIGVFSCEFCGFTYSLLGVPKTKEDELMIHRIINVGELWKNELEKLIKEKQTLKNISAHFCQTTNFIKKQADLYGIKTRWKHNLRRGIESDTTEKREKYREAWLRGIKGNPEKNKTQLTKEFRKTANWLYSHDKKWFNENSPSKPPKTFIRRTHVDWELRDNELLEKVKDMIENWDESEKPIRKTIFTISKQLNIGYLKKRNAEKLPLTMKYLLNEVENIDDFQFRRAMKVIKRLRDKNEMLSFSKVLYLANINTENMSENVKKKISNEIEMDKWL